jgi:hypothetical protein
MEIFFIERNKRLLYGYSRAAWVVGWLLVILGGVAGVLFLYDFENAIGKIRGLSENQTFIAVFERSWFSLLLPGLIALGVSQFLRYLLENESRPGFLLRHSDKVLFLYALLIVLQGMGGIGVMIYSNRGCSIYHLAPWFIYCVLPMGLLTGAKALILIGLAQILRRVLPMIEETKTLV